MPLMLSFATLVFLVGYVLAGSRHWQPQVLASIQKRPFSNPLDRQYFYINEGDQQNSRVPWPDKKIYYCYENEAARLALHESLVEAHDWWITNGLDKNFKLIPVKEKECRKKPYDVLHVKYSQATGPMVTFVGFPGENNSLRNQKEGENGQGENQVLSMILSDTTTRGMLDPVSNYVHELGHAWGLFHEHQNPAFWGGLPSHDGGSVFGPGNNNWNCESLSDYDRVKAKLEKSISDMQEMENLCKNQLMATGYNFSASEYLPLSKSFGISHSSGGKTDDVDWDSIMIYPSGAGAKTDATIPGGDKRMPILIRPDDGQRIKINGTPSQKDIQALHRLYGPSTPPVMKLLQRAGGSKTSAFKGIFTKSTGSDSSGCL